MTVCCAHKFRYWIKTIVSTLTVVSFAFVSQVSVATEAYVISALIHPSSDPVKALFRDIYAEVGLKVEFVSTVRLNGLKRVNNGIYDADLARLEPTIDKFDNLIKVPPSLGTVFTVLICKKSAACNANLLNDKRQTLLVNNANTHLIKELRIKANIVPFDSQGDIKTKLESSLFDYVIYTLFPSSIRELEQHFKIVNIKSYEAYHVVNAKHALLVPKLQAALQKRINILKQFN